MLVILDRSEQVVVGVHLLQGPQRPETFFERQIGHRVSG